MASIRTLLALLLPLAACASPTGAAAPLASHARASRTHEAARDASHEEPHHPNHLSLFLGLGAETRDGHADEEGFAFGAEYNRRLYGAWALGLGIEGLGQDTLRNSVVVVPITYYATDAWRLFVGPGYESSETKDKFVVRFGSGYDFPLTGGWTAGPQAVVDFVESGETLYFVGATLGYGW